MHQAVTGARLGDGAAELEYLTVGQHRGQVEHVVAGGAVLDGAQAAGVGGDVAADRAGLLAGVGRVHEAVRGGVGGQVAQAHAGLHAHVEVAHVIAQDLVHVHGAENHTSGKRGGSSHQAGAGAVLDVVTGKACPSGKLTETWPESLEDTPTADRFPSEAKSAEYREGLYVGYRYYQTAGVDVAFPFGYGLSYTTFEYSDLELGEWDVSFTVKNTGLVPGAEVAQVYVAKPEHEVFRPAQELKGFQRVELAPGESKRVTIELGDKAFRYFNVETNAWEVEGGTYEVRVAASSEDVRLTGTVEISGSGAKNPYEGLDMAPYETGSVQHVDDAHFAALLGHDVPANEAKIDRNMCFRDLNHGRSPLFWIVWLVLKLMKDAADKSGTPNLNVLFIWNMPLRALAKMTSGMLDMGVVDALVREISWWGLTAGAIALMCKLALGWGFIATWLLLALIPLLFALVVNLVKNAGMSSKLAKLEAKN